MSSVNLVGKHIVVTGANSGIGYVTAFELAQLGAKVTLVCRDQERGQAAVERIRAASRTADVELMLCDMADQRSIQAFCRAFRARHRALDVLVNNAGAYLAQRAVTPENLEATFAINHMGYFLTARGLLPSLRAAGAARIVNVASFGHYFGRINWSDINYEDRRYSALGAYCASKLMNIQFTRTLAEVLADDKIDVNCLHPGSIRSGFARKENDAFGWLVKLGGFALSSSEKGAKTSVFLASQPEVSGVSGEYFVRCKPTRPSRSARDGAQAERLWQLSESLMVHDPLDDI
ncbi:MAG: SDR family oxidoreductase [Bradymonadia bacterium]